MKTSWLSLIDFGDGSRSLIAIRWEAADRLLVERWMDEGRILAAEKVDAEVKSFVDAALKRADEDAHQET